MPAGDYCYSHHQQLKVPRELWKYDDSIMVKQVQPNLTDYYRRHLVTTNNLPFHLGIIIGSASIYVHTYNEDEISPFVWDKTYICLIKMICKLSSFPISARTSLYLQLVYLMSWISTYLVHYIISIYNSRISLYLLYTSLYL